MKAVKNIIALCMALCLVMGMTGSVCADDSEDPRLPHRLPDPPGQEYEYMWQNGKDGTDYILNFSLGESATNFKIYTNFECTNEFSTDYYNVTESGRERTATLDHKYLDTLDLGAVDLYAKFNDLKGTVLSCGLYIQAIGTGGSVVTPTNVVYDRSRDDDMVLTVKVGPKVAFASLLHFTADDRIWLKKGVDYTYDSSLEQVSIHQSYLRNLPIGRSTLYVVYNHTQYDSEVALQVIDSSRDTSSKPADRPNGREDRSDNTSTSSRPSNSSTSKPITTETAKKQTEQAVKEALANVSENSRTAYASVKFQNTDTLPLDAIKTVGEAASKLSTRERSVYPTIHADTVQGNVVQARLYVNPSAATKDIKPGVKVDNRQIENRLSKFYDNPMKIVSFEQKGSFGMNVPVAVRLDLSKLDLQNLVLYSYDSATNRYHPLESQLYSVDGNGYLHFTTSVGNNVIVSSGKLQRK